MMTPVKAAIAGLSLLFVFSTANADDRYNQPEQYRITKCSQVSLDNATFRGSEPGSDEVTTFTFKKKGMTDKPTYAVTVNEDADDFFKRYNIIQLDQSTENTCTIAWLSLSDNDMEYTGIIGTDAEGNLYLTGDNEPSNEIMFILKREKSE